MLKQLLVGSAALSFLVFGFTVLHAQEDPTTAPPMVEETDSIVEDALAPDSASSEVELDPSAQAPLLDGESSEISGDVETSASDGVESAEAPASTETTEPAIADVESGEVEAGTEEGVASVNELSEEELQQIAETINDLDEIATEAREKVGEAIVESGLSEERYVEIAQASQFPDGQADANISPEETQQFEQASAEVEAVTEETLQMQEQAIVDAGYDPSEFSTIVAQIRQDPELSRQLEEIQELLS